MADGTPHPPSTGRRGRRRPVLVVSVLVAVLLAGGVWTVSRPGRSPAPAAAASASVPPPDAQAVQALLRNRARAVRERDRIAFLATVSGAAETFREAQRLLFDNLMRLPLETWREEVDSPVPVATGDRGATMRLTLRYRLRGHDERDVVRTRYLTFAPGEGSAWRIVGDGTVHGLRDDADVWDGARIAVVRGRRSLVIGATGGLEEIAARLDAAVPQITEVVGEDWPRRAVALVPADDQGAAALTPGDSVTNVAALAVSGPSGEDRIVIAPGTFGRLNALGRKVVLTHELAHIATGAARDGRTPLWLIEGLADYLGYRSTTVPVRSAARELAREVAAGRVPESLPEAADFDGPARLPQVYAEAWLACRMIAERYGEKTLMTLYRTAGRRSQEAALRATLGVGTAEFTAMWRDYLRKELG